MDNTLRIRSKRKDIRNDPEVIPYVLFFGILILFNIIMMLRHEAWRDEAQAWLMAKQLSPISLLDELSYEGHPCLWFYLLMPFAKAGLPFVTLNIVSIVVMAVVIVLIGAAAPFDRISRMLFAASPLCIYAFSAISRSYCLVALLLVLLAMADRRRYEHPVSFCILIALLVQTHIVMIGMCFALCACHFFGSIFLYRRKKGAGEADAGKTFAANAASLLIPLASAIFLLYEFRDVGNAASVGSGEKAATFMGLVGDMVAAAKTCLVFLFTNFRFEAAACILLFVIAAVIFDVRLARGVIVCAVAMAFQLYVYAEVWGVSNYRHLLWLWQFFWFFWIAKDCMDQRRNLIETRLGENQLGGAQSDEEQSGEIQMDDVQSCEDYSCDRVEKTKVRPLKRKHRILYMPACMLLSLAIVTTCLASSWALIDDIKADYDGLYTDAQGAADFLEALPEDAVIFEGSGEFCNSVVARLVTKKAYSAFYEQEAGFCIRNKTRFKDLDYAGFEKAARKMFPKAEGVYVFFSDTSPEGCMGNIVGYPKEYTEVYATETETIRDEGYRIVYVPFAK
ncbi:MAG: hypothetical protein Q4A32_03010 [Lachnospiraceae bacterium]|nr:hypothetical protein [Lachnospiraceae bacterium]